MEIGSFIELQFPKGLEFYKGEKNIKRLNTGRSAIWHALRILKCQCIWLPYYQCISVREFLSKKNVLIKYYHIDKKFNPIDLNPRENEAVLLVNYYGVMSSTRMESLARHYRNVIIDNSQAFFSKPLEDCMNVYSCRKFVGVPDGAYVIGENAEKYDYPQSYSSDTAIFMLQRIEYGCEGIAYKNRQINEHRLDTEDCMKMSKLTHTILDGTDYSFIKHKRKENFAIAREFFDEMNSIIAYEYCNEETIPMVYPLLIENSDLIEKLQLAKHFQGHWWNYICKEMLQNTTEYWLSNYLIPITIDQRYGKRELMTIKKLI